jgi:type I restriction enzyme, S subunit
MKSNWSKKTIGDLCKAGGGQVQTGPFGSQLHQSDYAEDGTPVVMPADIQNGRIDVRRIARISEAHVQRLARHQLEKGDIVYGRRGDIGRQALVRDENIGWLCGTGCLRIRLGKSEVESEYLHRYLTIPEIVGWIEGQAIGATMPNLNTGILNRVPIYFPAKQTQRKIAAILTAYDDLIEANKRRIAMLEKMAEEIYREWFVRMRFPGYQNANFVKGIPEEWEMCKIQDAFQFTGGGTPSKSISSYWADGTVNWFTPSDITKADGIFLSGSEEKCSEQGLAKSSATLFLAYSIMMTSRATIGAIGINTTPACTNQGFITCIPNERYPLPYLYQWLKLAKPYFEQLCGGSTFPELTKGTFKKLEILTPPKHVADNFAALSNPILSMIEKSLQQNRNLTKTRDLLLPRLISGKLSVEDLDIQFPPSKYFY